MDPHSRSQMKGRGPPRGEPSAIIRLGCGWGQWVSEIGGLRLADVVIEVPRSYLAVRAKTAKLRRPRYPPLKRAAFPFPKLLTFQPAQRRFIECSLFSVGLTCFFTTTPRVSVRVRPSAP